MRPGAPDTSQRGCYSTSSRAIITALGAVLIRLVSRKFDDNVNQVDELLFKTACTSCIMRTPHNDTYQRSRWSRGHILVTAYNVECSRSRRMPMLISQLPPAVGTTISSSKNNCSLTRSSAY